MMDPRIPGEASATAPVFELHFGPRALSRSLLVTGDGERCETGQKGREVRWQQGAMAVCILAVYTRLCALRGAAEAPLLEGERGSPARSLDNALTKPGDWALNMFGEERQMPRIRDFIYRKKAVSKSNPVSAVQWDAERLPVDAIRIWWEGREIDRPEEIERLLRVLLEEFNPRRVETEWEALFPVGGVPAGGEPAGVRGEVGGEGTAVPFQPAPAAPPTAPPFADARSSRPWMLLLVLFLFVGIGAYFLGRATGPVPPPAEPVNLPAVDSAATVEEFLELLNARAYEEAYALTSASFREEVNLEAFSLIFGHQRFYFPRIAGNPYRNGADQRVHEYRVTVYVETEVRRIPALEGLARTPVTEIEAYAAGIEALIAQLEEAGVPPAFLRQLRKERLERPDASRYIQLVAGLPDEEIARLFPALATATLDLTYFFELVRSPEDGSWQIQTVSDAADRLVAF